MRLAALVAAKVGLLGGTLDLRSKGLGSRHFNLRGGASQRRACSPREQDPTGRYEMVRGMCQQHWGVGSFLLAHGRLHVYPMRLRRAAVGAEDAPPCALPLGTEGRAWDVAAGDDGTAEATGTGVSIFWIDSMLGGRGLHSRGTHAEQLSERERALDRVCERVCAACWV